jgi:hypothetical protein
MQTTGMNIINFTTLVLVVAAVYLISHFIINFIIYVKSKKSESWFVETKTCIDQVLRLRFPNSIASCLPRKHYDPWQACLLDFDFEPSVVFSHNSGHMVESIRQTLLGMKENFLIADEREFVSRKSSYRCELLLFRNETKDTALCVRICTDYSFISVEVCPIQSRSEWRRILEIMKELSFNNEGAIVAEPS